ncbi:scavenger receptor class B member 1-like isoform X1 [Colletes gigas]|uniref:scavenger receptor class B member 1-like isoform X1 n=1 Tax=Colletes gigas TaxID=935657 RepID=UPI001C9A5014|nr:scavenger receptor class B member 1-like isoform X1 [Colletes gigas]XP_043260497.1 scavenger receptor class B member 1-like isoform X1 [Colletes gigas]XP_043260498.1 scavenger receptor class B member 1-like isoform X1 [Colletes gigas]
MKDFMMIWSQLTGRRFSSVNVNQNPNDISELEEVSISRKTSLGRKSSIVVNRFFNATLPVHSNGRPKWSKSIFILMTLGSLSLATGCVLYVFQPYELLFKLKIIFGEGGEIFEMWRKPDVSLYLKVYIFNVTNHEEYLSGKESKLRFQELGPYVYRELLEHGDVKFNSNGTVTALDLHPLIYVPEMSNGTEEDIMILPNIALLSITNVMKDSAYLTRFGLNMLILHTDTQPLVKMTAREFMFGYESSLVTLGNKMMPSWIKFDKLGLIDRMYDFEGDYETVYTGETDVRRTGLIEKYNGNVNLPQWTGKCANVNGASDGVKFPSYIEPNDTILFFRKSLCRSAYMKQTEETVIKGLHTYKYKFVDNVLDNGAFNPENKCFCREGYCLQPGLIDVTDCYYGFPIALSYPHFYKTDPSILEAVEGLNPRADLHESYAYVQPKSGLPVNLAFRFQINMALQNIGHMARVEKFENLVLPLLWFEIGMYELPTSMYYRFWFYLNVLPVMQDTLIYSLMIVGIGVIFIGIHKILLHQPKGSTSSQQWMESEMRNQKLQFLNNRRLSCKTNEMDTYYSSLLNSNDSNVMSDITMELSNFKEVIV